MITLTNFRNAIDDYVDTLIVSTKMKDIQAFIYKGGISLALNKYEDLFSHLANSEGMINIDDVVKAFKPQLEKIGALKVGAFTFKPEDIDEFVSKMRNYDNGE